MFQVKSDYPACFSVLLNQGGGGLEGCHDSRCCSDRAAGWIEHGSGEGALRWSLWFLWNRSSPPVDKPTFVATAGQWKMRLISLFVSHADTHTHTNPNTHVHAASSGFEVAHASLSRWEWSWKENDPQTQIPEISGKQQSINKIWACVCACVDGEILFPVKCSLFRVNLSY